MLQTIFTQFQKVPDYGSLIGVPLFGSSFLKKERRKKGQLSFQIHPSTHREMDTANRGKVSLRLEIGLILFYVGKVLFCFTFPLPPFSLIAISCIIHLYFKLLQNNFKCATLQKLFKVISFLFPREPGTNE